ncbi:citrate synthase [Desulfosudis oleivorans]|uniref:Citrate synthase n=1 Tax=Desulfosudis oleivorans (strain DSM 6200 / JCM 39069 / Hxd3) TaxID=96561 RepID=A8ZX17_DESOH|nr:citrate synthase [Desulfosudis oleivorans]ABW66873.1 2-methylcitrate synthase/citrate synthase II [Desulfosudis oleivorans Hxd3]
MPNESQLLDTGLRGVKIAKTRISHVDGEAGKLVYRGFLINDLAESATYEEVAHLLLHEKLPNSDELTAFSRKLAGFRAIGPDIRQSMEKISAQAHPMDVLQAMIPLLATGDSDRDAMTRETTLSSGTRLVAVMATIVAAWHRIRSGRTPIDPDPALGHGANFLYMLTGRRPDTETARFFDVCLVLHAEHSFNASTFTARQVASTRAHMYAAVSAAIGSLSGELHGGANSRVMQVLLDIGSVDAIEAHIKKILDTGGKIMGLGHAVYKTGDPRANVLSDMSRRLGDLSGNPLWYDLTVALEQKGRAAFKKNRGLDIYPNIDFYSASVYYYMGIPIDLFTPVFAISRVAGWVAHVIEEQFGGAGSKPALYRPSAEYVGEYCGPEECAFIPVSDRK